MCQVVVFRDLGKSVFDPFKNPPRRSDFEEEEYSNAMSARCSSNGRLEHHICKRNSKGGSEARSALRGNKTAPTTSRSTPASAS
jgi:hypothetical protein